MHSAGYGIDAADASGKASQLGCLQIAAELTRELMVVVDAEAAIQYLNPAFAHLSGHTLKDMLGRKAFSLIKIPEDLEQIQTVLEKLRQGKSWLGNVELGLKNGTLLNIEVCIQPHFHQNKITHFLCTSHSHLLDDNPQTSEKKYLESLSHLANGVAHRFNNLLASVMGQTELIGMLSNDLPETMKRVHKILNVAEQGKMMVAQLMKFCQKQTQRQRRLDLLPILKNAIKSAQAQTPAKITWEVNLCDDCLHLLGNSNDLHDMIGHLFQNAITAMEESGGILSVELTTREDAVTEPQTGDPQAKVAGQLHLRIKDTGAGIDPKDMKYIFEPFFTTHNMATSVGMGLAVVYGVVQSHNGTIYCDSEVGRGTTFDLYFPAIAKNYGSNPTELMGPRGNGEHLLFIDSETMVIEAGTRQLESLGYEVSAFTDGQTAQNYLKASLKKIDLIIADCKTLKKFPFLQEQAQNLVPVMATYTTNTRHLLKKLPAEDFVKIIMKPCTLRELAESVQAGLEDKTD